MTTNHLDPMFRSHLRFFAFLFGNGTLVPRAVDVNAVDYDECIRQHPFTFGSIFAVYLNRVQSTSSIMASQATERAAQWLMLQCDPTFRVDIPFVEWELAPVEGTHTAIDAIKAFTLALGAGTLEPDILHDVDYTSSLIEYGSFLELIVTIFTNVLVVNEDGIVVNEGAARRRAAQYIRSYCTRGYTVTSPFKDWEIELQ